MNQPFWRNIARCGVSALGILLWFNLLGAAQQTLGGIVGTVTDSSGAVVPAANAELVSTTTGLKRTLVVKSNGEFAFSDLPAGNYTVTFKHDGFDTATYDHVLVQADRKVTLNVQMKVGSVATSIEVTVGNSLDTVDTTNGNVMESAQIENTPLGTGSFTQLATLAPGVSADLLSGTGTNEGLGNQNIWANGQRSSSNTFTFNSVMSNNLFNGNSSSNVAASRAVLNTGESFQSNGSIGTNTSIYDAIGQALPTPPQQTIAEMRVDTSMFDASEGATAGAHLDVTTKSGTNEYHGSIYGLLESGRTDADPFFNRQIGLPTPDLHRYWAGAELGGPVLKKQKLFFYTSYQYTRVRDQFKSMTSYYVPTGLTDDRSLSGLEAFASLPAKTDQGGGLAPGTQLDPVAVALLQAKVSPTQYLISSPLNPKSGGANVNFFGPASKFNAAQANGNLDYHLSDSDVISTKYYYQHDPTESPFSSGPLLGFPQAFQSGSQVFSLENNHIFSPKITWDQKFGFLRETAASLTSQPFGPSNIDGSGASINLFGSTLLPGITVGGFGAKTLDIGPTSNFSNTGFAQNTFEGTTNLNWVLGNHTLSFGANYDFTQLNILNRANQVASLAFTSLGNFIKQGGGVRTGGHTVYYQGASNRYYRAPQVGGYAQDHWRVTSKLNVTAGVRYDDDGGLYEKYGNLVNFDPTQYSYNASTDTIANAGLIVAGNNKLYHTPGASNSTLKNGQWGVAPRLGVAYSLRPDLVLRLGVGLYYDRGEFFTEFSPSAGGGFNGPFGVTLQPPFVQPVNAVSSGTLDNPFGTTAPVIDTNPADFISNLPNMTALINGGQPYLFGAYGLNNKLPFTENWSFDVQWKARPDITATVGYSGNHSERQTIPVPFNQPQIATPQAPLYANGMYPQTASYGYQIGNDEPYNTYTGGNTDLRTPYIGYNPNSVSWNTVGIANYDALLASVHKTVSHGLDMYVAYTYSHSLDDSSDFGIFYNGNDPRNLRQGYASSDFDQTHTIAISFSYALPKFNTGYKAMNVLANGWGMNGYSVLQSGQPYNVYDFSGTVGSIFFSSSDYLTNPVLPLAPGVTPKQALTGHSGAFGASDAAFNPTSFAYPTLAPGTDGVPADDPYESGFASGGRNIFRSAFQKSANIAFVKQTKIYERTNLRLSAEFLNITNTPSFDTPGNNFDGAPNFGPPYIPIGPGADPSTFSSQGVGVITNPIGGARQLQFTGILSF
ncbi:MAG: TonB-dependent receptor [Terracidiphilus sp.]|jgi:hypothetical protein